MLGLDALGLVDRRAVPPNRLAVVAWRAKYLTVVEGVFALERARQNVVGMCPSLARQRHATAVQGAAAIRLIPGLTKPPSALPGLIFDALGETNHFLRKVWPALE